MKSKVHMEVQDGKIVKVQDQWNGKLPDSTLLNVRSNDGELMQFFRRANAVTMPHLVRVPKEEKSG